MNRLNYSVEPCLRDEFGSVVALLVGYSDEEINGLLQRHPEWYRSTAIYYKH